MADGTPPPKPPGIQRLCSDNGSAPGPLTDKGGRFLWRMELDPMAQRACWIEATYQGFTSSKFEMAGIPLSTYSGAGVLTIPDLVLSPHDSGELNSITLLNDSEGPRCRSPREAFSKKSGRPKISRGNRSPRSPCLCLNSRMAGIFSARSTSRSIPSIKPATLSSTPST